jgi:hypothetical protein
MAAVGSDNEARPEHMLLTRRPGGSDSDDTISVSHERSHPGLVKDLYASRRRRVLQETVERPAARTVLGSVVGKLDVDGGVILSQPHDVRRRRNCAYGTADTHGVENVETWRMDGVSRQDLIARKLVLVQEYDRSTGSGEERRKRGTGASGADNDDVMMGLCSHGSGGMPDAQRCCAA